MATESETARKPSLLMPLEEARKLIATGCEDWPRRVDAAWTLSASTEASFADLLPCLKHRGLPQEFAAMRLYLRTKRPRADDSIESFVLDPQDWSEYLVKMNLK